MTRSEDFTRKPLAIGGGKHAIQVEYSEGHGETMLPELTKAVATSRSRPVTCPHRY